MTHDLFDRKKFKEIIGDLICPCLTPDTCPKREAARDLINSECKRNRIEAVREALKRLKNECSYCLTNHKINSELAELSKLQTKEGGK